jgi:rhodanese-related sulfurtransferase
MLVLTATFSSQAVWPYDAELAQSYAKLFADVRGAGAGKALHFMSPQSFIDDLEQGKPYVAIDVRTPAETGLFKLSLENSLAMPADQVFSPENLALIPVDKPVVIICKSGARATAVGTALRHIGFDNVFILEGGFQELARYYGPKQAYEKSEEGGKQRPPGISGDSLELR